MNLLSVDAGTAAIETFQDWGVDFNLRLWSCTVLSTPTQGLCGWITNEPQLLQWAGDTGMWRGTSGGQVEKHRTWGRSGEKMQNKVYIRLFGIILSYIIIIMCQVGQLFSLPPALYLVSIILLFLFLNSLSWHSIQVQKINSSHEETKPRYVCILSAGSIKVKLSAYSIRLGFMTLCCVLSL